MNDFYKSYLQKVWETAQEVYLLIQREAEYSDLEYVALKEDVFKKINQIEKEQE